MTDSIANEENLREERGRQSLSGDDSPTSVSNLSEARPTASETEPNATGADRETGVEDTFFKRLYEQRYLLLTLAGVFAVAAVNWPETTEWLVFGYLVVSATALWGVPARNRAGTMVPDRRGAARSPWPGTQVKRFIDVLPEPSVVLDGDGVVRHANPAMRDAFGSLPLGDPLTFKLREPALMSAIENVQMGGDVVTVPYVVKVPSERHFRIHIAPIRLPRPAHIERRAVSKGQAKKPDFISVIMFDQTDRFRVDQLRSDFIANVSHELRTPVASLTGFIETLIGPAHDDEATRDRFLKIMLEQARRMSRLVDDLLSLSRIEMRSHVRPRDEVDLGNVIGHVSDVMTQIAADAGLTLSVELSDDNMVVKGDQDELIQVFQNLVENACKYGADGDRIEIKAGATPPPVELQRSGISWFCVEVKDFGKGIAPDHIPRLTERFYRVDAEESKKKMGTGLGLAVVKHILTRHQGHLKITSAPDQGSNFQVYLMKLHKSGKYSENLN
ncbi:MAG: ATP-binding protein [Pseudomonadota bacterium]